MQAEPITLFALCLAGLALAVGLAPTQVREPLVHGVGALGALGLAFVMYTLGTQTRQI